MANKVNWREIFGKDADLLLYCQRRGHVTPSLDDLIDFLDEYIVIPDPAFGNHRRHLSGDEKIWLERLLRWRFGYKTFKLPLPCAAWWARALHLSERHMARIRQFLVGQGLLKAAEGWKKGLAYVLSIDGLLDKMRCWLHLKKGAFAEQEPRPPVPVPAPEPDPLPPAALVEEAAEIDEDEIAAKLVEKTEMSGIMARHPVGSGPWRLAHRRWKYLDDWLRRYAPVLAAAALGGA